MASSVIFPFSKDEPDIRDSVGIHPFSTFNSATFRCRQVFAIVAMGKNNEIGFNGDMPWHLPEDLRHFKEITMGHPVIMGRSTWLSIPKRPLPGRQNIVLSKNPDFSADGAVCCNSIEAAIAICQNSETPFIMGGGSIYSQAMPFLSRIFVTRIEAEFPNADTFFPEISPDEWALSEQSEIMTSKSGLRFRFETYECRNCK